MGMKHSRISPVQIIFIILICVFCAAPFVWMIISSLKPPAEIYSSRQTLLPVNPTADGFKSIISGSTATFNYPRWVLNSVIVSVSSSLISVLIASLGGYAMSRFRFRGRMGFGYMLLITQVLPTPLLLIPLYVIMNSLGLLNTLTGIVLVYTAFAIPYCTWTMKGYFDTIPVSIDEAALIDGCGRFRTFFSVVLPLTLPGLLSTTLFSFIQGWNEFAVANIFLKIYDKWTAPVGLTTFKGQYTTNWNAIMAGGIIITIPVVVIFWILQRHLISGMTAGGVKQ